MRRKFDDAYKQMAVELARAKGSIQVAAGELGVHPSLITQWKKRVATGLPLNKLTAVPTPEQTELRQLRKALKDAEMERDILKKAVSIFSKGDGRYTGL